MRTSEQSAFDELACYTLTHGHVDFIHQHAVDAFAAQTAAADDKPIRLAFALAGLYLHVVQAYTGRQVRCAHMQLARRKQAWPVLPLPVHRGAVTVENVVACPVGAKRDAMIHRWCESAWAPYAGCSPLIVALLSANDII